jgi:hypothetical protein
MISKKNSFLTFCFSFLPGAGQMYMGFMKRGVSLMSGFFLIIFFTVWFEMPLFVFAAIVLWFYAFFDTFNLRATPDDEFYAIEDKYIFFPGIAKEGSDILKGKYRQVLALGLILFGTVLLWHNIIDLFGSILPDQVRQIIRDFGYYFPQLLVGFAIIALGVYLITGKKKELDAIDHINELEDKGGYDK